MGCTPAPLPRPSLLTSGLVQALGGESGRLNNSIPVPLYDRVVRKIFQKFAIQEKISVAEQEPVEPTLFEIWSRSRNDLLNKYLLQTVWRIIGRRKTNFYLHWYCTTVIEQF